MKAISIPQPGLGDSPLLKVKTAFYLSGSSVLVCHEYVTLKLFPATKVACATK